MNGFLIDYILPKWKLVFNTHLFVQLRIWQPHNAKKLCWSIFILIYELDFVILIHGLFLTFLVQKVIQDKGSNEGDSKQRHNLVPNLGGLSFMLIVMTMILGEERIQELCNFEGVSNSDTDYEHGGHK